MPTDMEVTKSRKKNIRNKKIDIFNSIQKKHIQAIETENWEKSKSNCFV